MKVRVVKVKTGKELCRLDFENEQSVKELKQLINKILKISWLRQKLTYKNVTMSNHSKVGDYFKDENEVTIQLKDLGPQLPYKLLFILEYLGPLITVPLLYWLSGNKSFAAKYGAIMGCLHFLKRELESHYVHIFSNASVPVSGSIKNMLHYWVLFGVLAVGDIFLFKAPAHDWPRNYYHGFTVLWLIFQFMNLKTHIILRNLRVNSSGSVETNKRGVPKGCGFQMVHCANYLWEILSWTTYSVMTKSWMSGVFTLAGAITMSLWALQKKKKLIKYLKEHEETDQAAKLVHKPALFPFLL